MGSSPPWKVYNPKGEYVASCKEPTDAAILVGMYGAGAKIRYQHGLVVWHEGKEEFEANNSYDGVVMAINSRPWIRGEFVANRGRR